MDITSGMSCKHMAMARLKPSLMDASKPEPNG